MKSLLHILLLLFAVTFIYGQEKNPNDNCFRCHGMQTLGKRTDHSGLIKDLSIDKSEFELSNHAGFYCIDCHSEDFETFPHTEDAADEEIACTDCHEDDPDSSFIMFEQIETAFDASIHKELLGDDFTCFNCHDAHSFRIQARLSENIKQTVLYDNQICMDCHNNSDKLNLYTGRVFPNLKVTHDWLPHQQLHWENVRCIDCHTSAEEPGVAHNILPKTEAVRNCVECHSTESRLAHTLYKFQTQSERSEAGFFNAVIMNNSYVIGATRNYYLNILSFIIFGVTLIALSVHGWNYAGAKKRKTTKAKIHREYFYPLWLRSWHWVNAILFLLLIFSGITLQYASVEDPFLSFDSAITIHNTCGILLTLNYLLFFLGNLATGNYKQYIPKLKGIINRLFLQAKFYLIGIFRNDPHPFHTTIDKKFNPLQQITYLQIMYVAIPIMLVTGWALLFPEFIFEDFFGESGLGLTALLHTITGFFLSLFMFGHIYLATTGTSVMSNIRAMINGWHETEQEH